MFDSAVGKKFKKVDLRAIVYSVTTTVGGMSTGNVHIMKIISRVEQS